MKLARTKNAINSSIWGIINSFLSLILPFMVRTALIKALGMEYLGLSSLFTSILSILNLSELGIGSAIVFSMYKPIAENNCEQICALMYLYKRIYRVIGCIILLIGLAALPFLPNLISGDIPSDINIYVLYFIYLFNAVITYWLFAYRNSLLVAHQRNDVISRVALTVHSAMYIIQIAALLLFKNYYIYIIFIPLASIINNLIVAFFSRKIFPEYYCRGEVPKSVLQDIKKRVYGLAMNKIAYASRNAFDSVIVSSFLGLEMVAMYNNYYYVINAIAAFMRVFMNAILAGVGNSMETETVEKNENDLRVINFIYMSITCFGFSILICLYQPFMRAWVGDDYLFPFYIMISFGIYFVIEKAENVIGIYYDAAGLWWKGRWKGILEAVLNLFLNILLCRYLGVFGIVLATIVTMLLVGFGLTTHYVYKYYMKKSLRTYVLDQLSIILVTFLIGGIVYAVCGFIPEGNTVSDIILWMGVRMVVSASICFVLFIIIFCRTGLFKQSYKWIMSHVAVLRN